jgi:hypothetical protein
LTCDNKLVVGRNDLREHCSIRSGPGGLFLQQYSQSQLIFQQLHI